MAVDVLVDVEANRGTARDLLDGALRQRPLDPRDRDLAREIAYGVLRRLSTLDLLLRARAKRRLSAPAPAVRAALRVAAYQILFLDRIPAHAAVDAAVGRARRSAGPRPAAFANAVLRDLAASVRGREPGDGDDDPRRTVPTGDGRVTILARGELPDPARDPVAWLSARWSMPPWIVRRWRDHLGEEGALDALRASAARPGTWLRPLPARESDLRAALRSAQVAFEEEGGGFLVRGAGPPDGLPGHAEGWWIVQDPAATAAVDQVAVAEGTTVLELGAGRGGKTALLAARGALVTAVDPRGERLARSRETLERLGLLHRVRFVEGDATREGTLPEGPFDRLLVDAPCSNTGVLARRVEARWRVREADLEPLAGLGRRLLEAGLRRLRPGGLVVHSVCSLEPEEGPVVLRRALRAAPPRTVLHEERILPRAGVRDGGWVGVG